MTVNHRTVIREWIITTLIQLQSLPVPGLMSGIRVRVNIGSIGIRILHPLKIYSDATYGWLVFLCVWTISFIQTAIWPGSILAALKLGLSTFDIRTLHSLKTYLEAAYGWLVFPSVLDYLWSRTVCVCNICWDNMCRYAVYFSYVVLFCRSV